MKILFLLEPKERNMADRRNKWDNIERELKIQYSHPSTVESDELNSANVIITHRKEYNDNISSRLSNNNLLVVVFSGGETDIRVDSVRAGTIWAPFPHGITKIIPFVEELEFRGTVEYKPAIEAFIQSSINKQSNLISLSILCQGYLAAHAELAETNGEIKKALERMGWDRVPPELQKKVKEKQKDVRKVSWWQVFGDNAALWETIKSEWDEGWTADSDVAQLVKMISSDTAIDIDIDIDIDNEKAVAKAYLQLSSKLAK